MSYAVIGAINERLQVQTTFGTQSLIGLLQEVANQGEFNDAVEEIAFSQAARNFEVYVDQNDITTMGRNQFRDWILNELAIHGFETEPKEPTGDTGTSDEPKRPVAPPKKKAPQKLIPETVEAESLPEPEGEPSMKMKVVESPEENAPANVTEVFVIRCYQGGDDGRTTLESPELKEYPTLAQVEEALTVARAQYAQVDKRYRFVDTNPKAII